MKSTGARVAMVSMHTSPLADAGTRDSGGMNVLLLSVAAEFASRGVEVHLLTRAEGEPVVHEISDGVQLHELRAGGPGPIDKAALSVVADEFGESVAELGRADGGYDVIHAHYWLSGIATLPVAIELGIPFVQSFHTVAAMKNRTIAPGQEPEPEGRLRSEMFLATQANALIAGSAAEAMALIDEVGAPPERVWVVPPGVDLRLFRADRAPAANKSVRRELGIGIGRPIIAVAGRVQPLKDQALAIRALAELHALRGWAPVLVIAGESTPGDAGYLASLRELSVQLGVGDDVRFAGALSRERLADLFAAASVTILPSHSETFGLVALESAASGTPVVGSRATGLVESVAEGESGLLVDTRNPRAWAAAVTALLDEKGARGRMSLTARHHAEGYTWAATAAAMLGVYASLG